MSRPPARLLAQGTRSGVTITYPASGVNTPERVSRRYGLAEKSCPPERRPAWADNAGARGSLAATRGHVKSGSLARRQREAALRGLAAR